MYLDGTIQSLVTKRAELVVSTVTSAAQQVQTPVVNQSEGVKDFLSHLLDTSIANEPVGVLRVFSTRADDPDAFAGYVNQEIDRSQREVVPGRVWVIGTDLTGMTGHTTETFNSQHILPRARAAKLDVRILLSDPEYSAARAAEDSGEALRAAAKGAISTITS